jgi:hypothetical protein
LTVLVKSLSSRSLFAFAEYLACLPTSCMAVASKNWKASWKSGGWGSRREGKDRSHRAPLLCCYWGEQFGSRKLRKAAKGTKVCLPAGLYFVHFVCFRDLRVPILAHLRPHRAEHLACAWAYRSGCWDHQRHDSVIPFLIWLLSRRWQISSRLATGKSHRAVYAGGFSPVWGLS